MGEKKWTSHVKKSIGACHKVGHSKINLHIVAGQICCPTEYVPAGQKFLVNIKIKWIFNLVLIETHCPMTVQFQGGKNVGNLH